MTVSKWINVKYSIRQRSSVISSKAVLRREGEKLGGSFREF